MNQDYYATLNVGRNASEKDIKKAYNRLSKQLHPKFNKEEGAKANFKHIAEAYDVLGDATKKAEYDKQGDSFTDVGFDKRYDSGHYDKGFNIYEYMMIKFMGLETWMKIAIVVVLAILVAIAIAFVKMILPFVIIGGIIWVVLKFLGRDVTEQKSLN